MPLDNTAKMSEIISALQTMEGINAKADLASVIGTSATADDTMATLVNLIQQSKNELAMKMGDGSSGAEPLQTLVDRLFIGKKWASGTVKGGTDQPLFTNVDNKTTSSPYVSVTGITFEPTIIILLEKFENTAENFSLYMNSDLGIYKKSVRLFQTRPTGISTVNRLVKADVLPAEVTATGFTLPNIGAYDSEVKWIAIE